MQANLIIDSFVLGQTAGSGGGAMAAAVVQPSFMVQPQSQFHGPFGQAYPAGGSGAMVGCFFCE